MIDVDPGDRPTEYSALTLRHLHTRLKAYTECGDHRAVFLHAYSIVTRNMLTALEHQASGKEQAFLDPDWVCSLLNHFADLYFDALDNFEETGSCSLPWERAHKLALSGTTTVVEDLLLGINAHINFDLPQALYRTMVEFGDERNALGLWRRKFDHDKINAVLRTSIEEIASSISEQHGGMIAFLDRVMGRWDERVARFGIEHFRENTFDRACQLLAARTESEKILVQSQLQVEAGEVVDVILKLRRFGGGLFHRIQCKTRKRALCIDLQILLPEVAHEQRLETMA
jgi:hypothetical protein